MVTHPETPPTLSQLYSLSKPALQPVRPKSIDSENKECLFMVIPHAQSPRRLTLVGLFFALMG
ncbi:conserved hypothetical protein [Vibrio crassostreae]|nr:conserved hypothetical protein [Vibrio crassostreae]